MADETKTTDALFWGYMRLLMDAYGTTPTSEVGYKTREKGVEVTIGRSQREIRVEEYAAPVVRQTNEASLMVKCGLQQFSAAQLAKALGISSSTLVGGGGITKDTEYAARLVGSLHNWKPLHLYIPKCVSGGDLTIPFGVDKDTDVEMTLHGLDNSTGLYKFYVGAAQETVAISTGVATIVKKASPEIAWILLQAETGTSDALTSIEGSVALDSDDDGIICRIQPDSGDTLTITHAADTLELKGAANLTLDQTGDWVDLYFVYDAVNPKWVEITHYLAP